MLLTEIKTINYPLRRIWITNEYDYFFSFNYKDELNFLQQPYIELRKKIEMYNDKDDIDFFGTQSPAIFRDALGHQGI